MIYKIKIKFENDKFKLNHIQCFIFILGSFIEHRVLKCGSFCFESKLTTISFYLKWASKFYLSKYKRLFWEMFNFAYLYKIKNLVAQEMPSMIFRKYNS